MIDAAELRELLHYDPDTGLFTWLVDANHKVKAGTVAGALEATGYVRIYVKGKPYKGHRLAWLYMTGEWPSDILDHKDRNRANNRWRNLREATRGQNRANSRANGNSRTGLKGVRRHGSKFEAQINSNGVKVYLGIYDTPDEAAAIYRLAARDMHGEFART